MNYIPKKLTLLATSLGLSLALLLSACGSGNGSSNDGGDNGDSGRSGIDRSDPNLYKPELVAPSISINENNLVSNTTDYMLIARAQSPAKKKMTMSARLNGKDLGLLTLDMRSETNFDYRQAIKLNPGDNTLELTAQETNGLSSKKSFVIHYNKDIDPKFDFYLKENTVYQNKSETIKAFAKFSDTTKIKSVELVGYPNSTTLATLKDDGVAPDAVQKDNKYSANYTYVDSPQANKCFRAKTNLQDGTNYLSAVRCLRLVKDRDNQDFQQLDLAGQIVAETYAEASGINPIAKAKNTVETLKKNPNFNTWFKSMQYTDEGDIFFELPNGLRGSFREHIPGTKSMGGIIRENTVQYLGPFNHEFEGFLKNGGYVKQFKPIKESKLVTENTAYLNGQAKLDQFKKINQQGIIHINTHGGIGDTGEGEYAQPRYAIMTGEEIPMVPCGKETRSYNNFWKTDLTKYCADISQYADDYKKGRIRGYRTSGKPYHSITREFFKEYYSEKNEFEDMLIYVDSCNSATEEAFREVFLSKGAAAYIGYIHNVDSGYADKLAETFYEGLLAGDSVTTAMTKSKEKNGSVDSTWLGESAYAEVYRNDKYTDVSLSQVTNPPMQNGDFEQGTPQACDPIPKQEIGARSRGFGCMKEIISPSTPFGYGVQYYGWGIRRAVDSFSYYNAASYYQPNTIWIKPPSGKFMAVHESFDDMMNVKPFSIPKNATRLSFDFNRIFDFGYVENPNNPYNYVDVLIANDPLNMLPCIQNDCPWRVYKFQLNPTTVNKPMHSDPNAQNYDKVFQTGWVHVDVPLPAGLNHDQIYLNIDGGMYIGSNVPFLVDNIQFK